jgi:predicted transcriptional regulator
MRRRGARRRRDAGRVREAVLRHYNPSRLTGELALSDASNPIELTTQIVASYVGGNQIAVGDLPALIKSVYAAMGAGDEPDTDAEPAVTLSRAEIRKSIRPEGIRSFEDGKVYKSLKRHLRAKGLNPAEYRAKWGLPADYKMVSEAYSEQRSAMAKALGLGRKTAAGAPKSATAATAGKTAKPTGKRRGQKPG